MQTIFRCHCNIRKIVLESRRNHGERLPHSDTSRKTAMSGQKHCVWQTVLRLEAPIEFNDTTKVSIELGCKGKHGPFDWLGYFRAFAWGHGTLVWDSRQVGVRTLSFCLGNPASTSVSQVRIPKVGIKNYTHKLHHAILENIFFCYDIKHPPARHQPKTRADVLPGIRGCRDGCHRRIRAWCPSRMPN